jgi:recombination protein RecT
MTESNVPAPAQTRAITPIEGFRQTLQTMEREFAVALPPQIPVGKFVRTVITTVQMNPQLLECDRRSLFATAMKAAQDGLLLDGREAAPVVFRTKNGPQVQYMPMIGGLLKKLRNSGELKSISAHTVHEHDTFDYELGDEERIVHKPRLDGDRGRVIAAYAVAKTKDGGIYREVMSLDEIEKVRNVSRAKDAGPWASWYEEMAKKTVLRRLMKRLPSSADLDAVVEADNETYDLKQAKPVDQAPVNPMAALKAKIGIGIEEATPPSAPPMEDHPNAPRPEDFLDAQ